MLSLEQLPFAEMLRHPAASHVVINALHACVQIGNDALNLEERFKPLGTVDLVQRLQVARRELALPAALAKLDKFDLLVLDDVSYVRKDQAETSALFELIAERYERRSLLITANQPFSAWDQIFPDPAMTVAAIDRLVHHATIFELNVESYRRRAAIQTRPTTIIDDNQAILESPDATTNPSAASQEPDAVT